MTMKRPLLAGAVPLILASAMATSFAGQAFAAPAQPGTVKESAKPAAQPGTKKESKTEAKPAPKPVVQPVRQEAPAPAAKPVVQENATDVESTSGVTPVRQQGSEPEIESVREKNATLTTGEFRTAVHTTEEEHRDSEVTSPDVKVARTDEEESAEILPDLNEDGEDADDTPDVPVQATNAPAPAPAPAAVVQPAEVAAASDVVEPAPEASDFSGGASVTGANAGAEITADTTATTGLVHSEINVGASDGAGLTVDTDPTTSLVQGDLSILGQQIAGDVQVTAVESQLYEVTANGGAPLVVEIPTEVTTAVEHVTEKAQQMEIPVEVTTAAEQANTAFNDAAQQVSDAIPPASAVEAALPAGAVANAWYEVTK